MGKEERAEGRRLWEGSERGQKVEASQAQENEKLQSETLWKGCW